MLGGAQTADTDCLWYPIIASDISTEIMYFPNFALLFHWLGPSECG